MSEVQGQSMIERLGPVAQEAATLLGCTESQALVAVGTYMSEIGKEPAAKDVLVYVISLKTRPLESFNQAEVNLLLELGCIQRKQFPFRAIRIGRNEKCQCDSGKKYKNCCLPEAEKLDRERYQLQNGRPA